ncbi:MAG: AEC family transporter [Phycisphaerales bacterium]|jgi:malate permease and related proteins|nr:AEC family transporter [Phycisphaerales bacterium]
MFVAETLLPIFLIIALGFEIRHRGIMTADVQAGLTALVFRFALPALILGSMLTAKGFSIESWRLLEVLLVAMVVMLAVAFVFCRIFKLTGPTTAVFLQAAYRGNWAFVGLPVIQSVFAKKPEVIETMVLAMGPMVLGFNVVSVLLLLAGKHSLRRESIRPLLGGIVRNPLLIACFFGIVWVFSRQALPDLAAPGFLIRTLREFGEMALPAALICVGANIASVPIGHKVRLAVTASLAKVALMPLIGYGLCVWFGLEGDMRRVAIILLAIPTAVSSYIMADRLGGDAELAAGCVVLSHLLSAGSLAAVLLLFGA